MFREHMLLPEIMPFQVVVNFPKVKNTNFEKKGLSHPNSGRNNKVFLLIILNLFEQIYYLVLFARLEQIVTLLFNPADYVRIEQLLHIDSAINGTREVFHEIEYHRPRNSKETIKI